MLLVTEEASAAMYARRLAREISSRGEAVASTSDLGDPGGPARLVTADPAPLSALGFVEVLAAAGAHARKLAEIARFVRDERPRAVVTVDYGGFAMLLARLLGHRAPFHFFIPPKIWVWGRFRGRMIARRFARVHAIFPFEAEAYRRAGAAVDYVGHPLVELVAPHAAAPKDPDLVALLPGSRPREVEATLPVIAEAVDLMLARDPALRFACLAAGRADRAALRAAFSGRPVTLVDGEEERRAALARASAAIAKSGTGVLEAALLDTPCVALYRVNPLSALVARRLLGIGRVTLPNLVLGREVVPELLQEELRPEAVARRAERLLRCASLRRYVLAGFAECRRALEGPGGSVFARVAGTVLGEGRRAA